LWETSSPEIERTPIVGHPQGSLPKVCGQNPRALDCDSEKPSVWDNKLNRPIQTRSGYLVYCWGGLVIREHEICRWSETLQYPKQGSETVYRSRGTVPHCRCRSRDQPASDLKASAFSADCLLRCCQDCRSRVRQMLQIRLHLPTWWVIADLPGTATTSQKP